MLHLQGLQVLSGRQGATMIGAYVGAGVERVLYNGFLFEHSGRICGEVPDFDIVS